MRQKLTAEQASTDAAEHGLDRRGLLPRLLALAASVATPVAPRSSKAAGNPKSSLSDFFGTGAVSVTSWGAVGDGVHDDTDAFLKACEAAPLNGVIIVPRTRGSYRIRRGIPLRSRSLVGVGWPVLAMDATDGLTDMLEVSVENGSYDQWHQGATVSGLVLNGAGKGRDLIRVGGMDSLQISNVRLVGAGRDGLHVEGIAKWSWTESLNVTNAFISTSKRDNFHLAVPEEFDFTFVNQSTFMNCKSRSPGRYALACINRSRNGGDNSKISEVSWINGELDGTGGIASDIVLLQTLGRGAIELINFYDVAIEDVRAEHPGFGIRTDSGGGGSVGQIQTSNCIFYGAASGGISKPVDHADSAQSDLDTDGPSAKAVLSGRTELLQRARAEVIGSATGHRLQKVFATAIAGERGAQRVHGEWTLFGDEVAAVTEVGCTLRVTNGKVILTNAARTASVFEWHIQSIG